MFSGMTEHANALSPLTSPPVKEVNMARRSFIRFHSPRKNLAGQRFGKLVVESWAGSSQWNCRCDCGGKSVVFTANLKRGNTTSCGCIRNIKSSKRATVHGLSKTPAYKTWVSIKRRCYEIKNPSYKTYGAKGITLCDQWKNDCVRFVADVGQPPTPDHSLDRINPRGNYEPGNVRWATPMEQGCNKTNNRWVTYQGERYTISQLARKIAAECEIEPSAFQRAFEKAIYDV
jgi:hypothetical protein